MTMLLVIVPSAIILLIAYFTYGSFVTRLLRLDNNKETPAHTYRDDLDYAPLESSALMSQHFSAIAAAGPIVGPIVAGMAFGWLPALCWIIVGSIFIGGVHDMTALFASVRHKARSIAEVVREHMSHRAFIMFLMFVWLALVYIVVAFTDLTAGAFVKNIDLEKDGVITGAGIATSSIMYLILPIIMGFWMRYGKLSLGLATLIFVPLIGLAIYVGQFMPLDLTPLSHSIWPGMDAAATQNANHKLWNVILLLYCCFASITPMWALLQPRGHLGGYYLYIALIAGALGLVISNNPVQYPAYRGFIDAKGDSLVPILFITIACGACSGFHALISSGTTSKQLRVETDAKRIGYGAMLLEAMVAIVSLCCVMRLPLDSKLLTNATPDMIYATGIGSFLETFSLPAKLGVAFALMAFTTFVYDTLDVCTRLGRFIIQELTGWQSWGGKLFGTLITAGVPMFFVTQTLMINGKPAPMWRTFWGLFGASNQLLAALTLIGVTIWLWRTREAIWVWFVTGIPAAFMYAMSIWSLGIIVSRTLGNIQSTANPPMVEYAILTISILLLTLAALMLVEAIIAILPRKMVAVQN
jgi:carbon starvation protein